jgi:hypothetical protein
MKIYPVAGRLARDEHNRQPVPAEGREVRDDDPYWVRRVRDGDVTTDAPEPERKPEGEREPQQDRAPIPPRKEA